MNCLVTGGRGFVGRFLVEELTRRGSNIAVLSRTGTGEGDIRGDLTSESVDLGDTSFDVVFHLAGRAHRVPRSAAEREEFFVTNVGGTERLFAALERLPKLPSAVVLASTVAVYGQEQGELLPETTPREAADAYGASKREAEDVAREWGRRQGVPVAIVRLPLVVGRDAPGNLGAMVSGLSRGRYLGIGSGDARRSMVLASDVAHILPNVAGGNGVFHLTDGHHPSFAELEGALCRALNKRFLPRLPLFAARWGGYVGDQVERLSGRTIPLNSRTVSKMTSTLTFSDQRARDELEWSPSRVLDHIEELVAGEVN